MNKILERYVPIADMLVGMLPDAEVVIHDLADVEHSVVYVAGSVTGRAVGQGIEHLVREFVSAEDTGADFALNDYFRKKGKLIRSSSLFIRDEERRLIGAMCINLDMTRVTQQLEFVKALMPEPAVTGAEVGGSTGVEEMVTALVDSIIGGSDIALLAREERIAKIAIMQERGIFQVKGAIDQVAKRLGINRVTVYSYLDELKKRS